VFVRFFSAHAISVTGTAVTQVVLPILVFQRTHSALQTSLLTTIEVAPYLAFGLFAGVIADRADRRRLMVRCDLLQVALLGSVAVAAALDVLTTPQLFVIAVASATTFVWFDAANFGALPALVGRDRVVAANSAMWTFDSLALIIGPALGATIAAATDPAFALGVDAVTYLASALLLRTITRPFEVGTRRPGATRWGEDLREGLRFLWGNRVVRALTLTGFGNSVSFGAVLGLTVVVAVRQLGVPDHDARIGVLYSAGAVGSLLGAVLLPRLVRGRYAPRLTVVTLHAAFAATVAIALTTSFAVAVGLWLVWQLVVQLTILNGIAYRQQVTPDHLQSRVNVVARMLAWGGQPFGAALGGVLAVATDVRTALLLTSAAVGIAAATSWRPLWAPPGGGSGGFGLGGEPEGLVDAE
jgi:MFS family permease